jgi:hypothetical protein
VDTHTECTLNQSLTEISKLNVFIFLCTTWVHLFEWAKQKQKQSVSNPQISHLYTRDVYLLTVQLALPRSYGDLTKTWRREAASYPPLEWRSNRGSRLHAEGLHVPPTHESCNSDWEFLARITFKAKKI